MTRSTIALISIVAAFSAQHDYYILEYRNFGWIQLNQWPVIEVNRVSSFFPTSVKIFARPSKPPGIERIEQRPVNWHVTVRWP